MKIRRSEKIIEHTLATVRAGMALGVVGFFAASLLVAATMQKIGPPALEAARAGSVSVVDRNGQLLRAFTTTTDQWRLPVSVDEVDPRYLDLLLAFEDKRFWHHAGADPLALARAGWQLISNRRIVSGASTLTMQVARLVDGEHRRTADGKLHQIARALQLEQQLSKREILELYLRLAPFGGNLTGVRAASIAYFGKEPKRLTLGEAALLVALPQSPEWRRPDRQAQAASLARAKVLQRAVEAGLISAEESRHAQEEKVPTRRRDFPKLAPHLSEAIVAAQPEQSVHRLTLERDLQSQLEQLAHERARSLGARHSAAIIVIEHASGEVLAHVGASDYFDLGRAGAIDMTRAVRSPGSALKPFIYGLGFEAGLIHPETLIEDRPTRFADYTPKNFDDSFHGTVSIREALQKSLNIPAVKVLEGLGPTRLAAHFRDLDTPFVLPPGETPSLAIALGGVGITLHDLARLYAGLARGGKPVAIRYFMDENAGAGRDTGAGKDSISGKDSGAGKNADGQDLASGMRLLNPVAAWYVGDILSGTAAPEHARGGRIAYKTGTSYGYRDAWAIGFDGKHTIAVWTGRPDGAASPGHTGTSAAAPILFDAFQRISRRRIPLGPAPADTLAASNAELPPPLRRFRLDERIAPNAIYADAPVQIAFPPDKAQLELPAIAGNRMPVQLKANGGKLPLTWLVNGAPIEAARNRREAYWQPDGAGFAELSVIDANGQTDRITIRLQ